MSGDEGGGQSVRRPRSVQRAQVGPGPLRDLKTHLYEAYLAAGAPTLDEIAAAIADDDALVGAPSRDTVRRVLSSPELPAQQADVVAVASVLARAAKWDEQDLSARVRGLWIESRMAAPAGQMIATLTDPFALEVHRAIEVSDRVSAPGVPLLPIYIQRAHDDELRRVVWRAAAGTSAMAVLVGASSTGKTRACWEAVQSLPAGWRLWHPIDPSRPEAALRELDEVGPQTVIWLNESQHYLLTPAGELGERLAARLRSLLKDPSRCPVLVLGTIWPEYWAVLTYQPEPTRNAKDPHTQARDLLAGTGVVVPSRFTPEELVSLEEASLIDARLASAVEGAEQGQITQYLAGAPALLEKYRTAPPTARALIDAAMDARHLGHGPALPHGLLEAAAECYLTDLEWDSLADDWLEQALAYCATPVHGARGPLSRIRPRRGEPPYPQPHYRLADFLEQHGRASRSNTVQPAALWDALADHAVSADLTKLGLSAAANKRLHPQALRLFEAAFRSGDRAAAASGAIQLLERAGRVDDALAWYQRIADCGDDSAGRRAATMLERAGRTEEALLRYMREAESGDTIALGLAATVLYDEGRTEEAITWLLKRADAGDSSAPGWIAPILRSTGQIDEALAWYLRAADAGDTNAQASAATMLRNAGRKAEAARLEGPGTEAS